ncbi:DUF1793-domain-containing protein [Mycena maculata]|uniref:DUF1793-domain-containing protein n=1 Tax=Mycena maculata TaxID=230809 RepID=A0AAD7JW13_9AGAR|nr:DUF1793-domain-containing protein [Mycena maculata]
MATSVNFNLNLDLPTCVGWTATPFLLPSYPLAVRTPYLSAWLPQGSGNALSDVWPQYWTGRVLGWAGFVNVDGATYSYLGNPADQHQSPPQFTSTQSTFVMTTGPVELTVNFLSPVEPENILHQSIPFTYLAVSAVSTDGGSHSVSIFSDISAEWTHQVQLVNQTEYGEFSGQSQTMFEQHPRHLTLHLGGQANSLTYQTGEDTVIRAQFIENARLPDTQDTNFRAVDDAWPVFAFAHTLSVGTTASTPVKFSIGQVRDPAMEYIIVGNAYQKRSYYWWSTYSSVAALISDFINAYPTALATANTFDAKVQTDVSAISDEYAGIAASAVRQTFGATELTISKGSDGSWNTSGTLMFLKRIEYPAAIGHNLGQDEKMPIEESGNMLIMALDYTQRSGNISMASTYTLLGTGLVPSSVMDMRTFENYLVSLLLRISHNTTESTYYSENFSVQFPTWSTMTDFSHLADTYGFPIDSRPSPTLLTSAAIIQRSPYTSAMWQLWTACTTSTAVRDTFFTKVYNWLTSGLTDIPFGDRFLDGTGATSSNQARPVVGSVFALRTPLANYAIKTRTDSN